MKRSTMSPGKHHPNPPAILLMLVILSSAPNARHFIINAQITNFGEVAFNAAFQGALNGNGGRGPGATSTSLLTNTRNTTAAGIRSKLVVMTSEGAVLGRMENREGLHNPIRAFRGIPYAAAPVGPLRFKSPQRFPPWKGIKITTEYQSPCLAYIGRFFVGDEDCLFLNVFVPEKSNLRGENGLLPVVFWVYGGGFIHGGEMMPILYHPETVTDKGFIFVTINYRLAALGFLSTDDSVLPGNYAMKDMVMSLKWVQRNIRRFGGDPNRVNIFGQSCGAVAVHALSLSPMAKGLFNSAIAMSGSLVSTWGFNPQGRPIANLIAREVSCPTGDSSAMLECFRQRGAKEIIFALQSFFTNDLRYSIPFGVVVDPQAADPFMPEHPLKILSDKNFKSVPFIFGSLPHEMNFFLPGFFYDQSRYDSLVNDWDDSCGNELVFWYSAKSELLPAKESMTDMCRRTKSTIFRGKIDPDGSAKDIVQFSSEISFRFAAYAAAILHAKFSDAPVYYYSWDHANEGALRFVDIWNYMFDNNLQILLTNITRARNFRLESGKSHSDELFLFFDPDGFHRLTQSDKEVKALVSSMFSSFWADEDSRIPVSGSLQWPRFDFPTQKHLSIDSPPKIGSFSIEPQRQLIYAQWYDIYQRSFTLNRPPRLTSLLGLAPDKPNNAIDDPGRNLVRGARKAQLPPGVIPPPHPNRPVFQHSSEKKVFPSNQSILYKSPRSFVPVYNNWYPAMRRGPSFYGY